MKKWLVEALFIYKVCPCLLDRSDFDTNDKNFDYNHDSQEDSYDIDWDANTRMSNPQNSQQTATDSDLYNASFRSSEIVVVNPLRSSIQIHQNRFRRNQEEKSVEPRMTESKPGIQGRKSSISPKVKDLDSEKFVRFGR